MTHENRIFRKDTYRGENPISIVRLFCQDIKFCLQRICKGYCDRDLWNIDYWFLQQFPSMLEEFKKNTHGYPSQFNTQEEWENVIDKMIFLFHEANQDTCSKRNPYEIEYSAAFEEFSKKYGSFGEKLRTPDEIECDKSRNVHTM